MLELIVNNLCLEHSLAERMKIAVKERMRKKGKREQHLEDCLSYLKADYSHQDAAESLGADHPATKMLLWLKNDLYGRLA